MVDLIRLNFIVRFYSPPFSSRLSPLSSLFFSYSCPLENVVGHRQRKEPLQEIAGEAAPVPELVNSQLGLCAPGEQICKPMREK